MLGCEVRLRLRGGGGALVGRDATSNSSDNKLGRTSLREGGGFEGTVGGGMEKSLNGGVGFDGTSEGCSVVCLDL